MKLKNHIAYRFLTDDTFAMEMLEAMYPNIMDKIENGSNKVKHEIYSFNNLIENNDNKSYWITSTVLDKLNLLKVKRNDNNEFDWSIFKDIRSEKITLIFPDNRLLRMETQQGSVLTFMHLKFVKDEGSTGDGEVKWDNFWADLSIPNRLSENFTEKEIKNIDEFIYKLLIFFYLSENELNVLQPNEKHGTKKTGKIVNELPFPLTVVDNNWNVTSIRLDGFGVKGHFAVRWTGKGRTTPRMVFIKPFEKNGYIRKAKNNERNRSNIS